MRISEEQLQNASESTGFRADILEKVLNLMNLLKSFRDHPILRDKFALKGGTALNLFYLPLPRLSVDIDLNYIGSSDKEVMLSERPDIEKAVQAVCAREGFSISRIPDEHAGGKFRLRFNSISGSGSNLEIDINYMYRVPLWPLSNKDSHMIGPFQAKNIQLVDIHELAAGKLAALLSRHQARDLFDSHMLLRSCELDPSKLRLAFIIYGAMNKRDWRDVSIDSIDVEETELKSQLIPTLSRSIVSAAPKTSTYGKILASECKEALSGLFPFTQEESEFLNLLLDNGEIRADLLTANPDLMKKIESQPMLKWKALNVKQFRSGNN